MSRWQKKKELHETYPWMYPALLGFAVLLILFGIIAGGKQGIWGGLKTILLSEGVLITDYIALAGIGPAFINAGLVMLASVFVLHTAGVPANGFMMCIAGLMAGFALFGKNIANIWPIIFGTWLYAKVKKEPFKNFVSVALLSATISPIVSMVALYEWFNIWNLLFGCFAGVVIGFVMPAIASYTAKIQNGISLYNVGFAAGMLAMILVPLLNALGFSVEGARVWSTGNNTLFGIGLFAFCGVAAVVGLLVDKQTFPQYKKLLKTSGTAPSDYLEMFGIGPVLLNLGINGILVTAYILLIGGDLNGPTIGGILTILGFSSFGKHLFNIVPIMAGIVLGSLVLQWNLTDYSMQIIALFGTTLTPIAGHFGWPYGILAGFLHSSAALKTGLTAGGLNLYNNGFTGGIITIVLYPLFLAFAPKKTQTLIEQEEIEEFVEQHPEVEEYVEHIHEHEHDEKEI